MSTFGGGLSDEAQSCVERAISMAYRDGISVSQPSAQDLAAIESALPGMLEAAQRSRTGSEYAGNKLLTYSRHALSLRLSCEPVMAHTTVEAGSAGLVAFVVTAGKARMEALVGRRVLEADVPIGTLIVATAPDFGGTKKARIVWTQFAGEGELQWNVYKNAVALRRESDEAHDLISMGAKRRQSVRSFGCALSRKKARQAARAKFFGRRISQG